MTDIVKTLEDALEVIKKQKAEIERLRENNQKLYEEMVERQKEEVAIAKRMGKSEAIKKFAKRLKERMFGYYECLQESVKGRPYKGDTLMDYEVVDMIEDSIDNLVKEMTEVSNEK